MRLQPASKGFELSGRLRVRETGPKKNFQRKLSQFAADALVPSPI
jgi:hypothetical protein